MPAASVYPNYAPVGLQSGRPAVAIAMVLLPVIIVAAGCGNQPADSEVQAAIEVINLHELSVSDSQVEVTSLDDFEGDDRGAKWHVKFKRVDTAKEAWLKPMDMDAEIQSSIAPGSPYANAVQQIDSLRQPEIAAPSATHRELRSYKFPPMFKTQIAAGKRIEWTGAGILTKRDDDYEFELTADSVASDHELTGLTPQKNLPAGAVIASSNATDPLQIYRKLQQRLIEEVQQARTALTTRLAEEKKNLLALREGAIALSGNLQYGRREIVQCDFRFDKHDKDDLLSAVAIDREDTLSRVVFDGSVQLPEINDRSRSSSRLVHDGWSLRLKNADATLSKLAGGTRQDLLVFYDVAAASYKLSGPQGESKLQLLEEDASTGPALRSDLLTRLAAGQQYTGMERISSLPNRVLEVSNMHYDATRQLFRIVVQEKGKPFRFGVFEGKVRFDSPHHLGLPVRLSQVAHSQQLYGDHDKSNLVYKHSGLLTLAPTASGWVGRIGTSDVSLEKAAMLESMKPAPERWKYALTPGFEWKGSMQWKDEPLQAVRMRVADYRHEENYVRLILEKLSDAKQYVVYEGSLMKEDGSIDGYGLVMHQRGRASLDEQLSDGVFFNKYLYSRDDIGTLDWDPKHFRLSPQGNQLYAVSKRGKKMMLTLETSAEASDTLKEKAATQRWTSAFQTPTAWEGTLFAHKTNESAKIMMTASAYDPNLNQIQIEMVAAGNARMRVIYTGALNKSEKFINGYALNLISQKGSESPSKIFRHMPGRKIQFRLSEDGSRLFGRLTHHQYEDHEFIELSPRTTMMDETDDE